MSFDAWAAPGTQPTAEWGAPPAVPATVLPAREPRLKRDVATFAAVVVGMVLLAAPVGLLWSALAPHYTVIFVNGEATYPNIESSKAIIGADGTYTAVIAAAGLLCGAVAWLWARKSGPWTVAGLALGGILAAVISAQVGLLPGREESFQALERSQGEVDVFLGQREGDDTSLRAPWAAVAWPVLALVAFVVPGYVRPEELD